MAIGKAEATFLLKYTYGHPNIKERDIPVFIKIHEDELLVRRQQLIREGEELFKIPYEKIESVTLDIEKEWKGTRLAAGLVALGPVGALLFGKKKTEHLGLMVIGRDKEGNAVEFPIIFRGYGSADLSSIKTIIDQKIGQTRGVTI